jgi:hypothetical protein
VTRRFRYLLEPLCIAACVCYAANRWLVKPHVAVSFLHGHFNDILLIPCALPLVLWLQRRLGLREHDRFPTLAEVTAHLAVWTLIAEWIGPRWLNRGTGDVWDVAAYALGAAIALTAWRNAPGRSSFDRAAQ